MYVEVVKSRQNGREYRTTLIRETYREGGKVKHRTVSNISKLPDAAIALVRQSLSGAGTVDQKSSGDRLRFSDWPGTSDWIGFSIRAPSHGDKMRWQ